MISLLRGLMATEDNVSGRPLFSVLLLGVVDFVCILNAGELYKDGRVVAGTWWLIVGVLFSAIGYYWSSIKIRIANASRRRLAVYAVLVATAIVGCIASYHYLRPAKTVAGTSQPRDVQPPSVNTPAPSRPAQQSSSPKKSDGGHRSTSHPKEPSSATPPQYPKALAEQPPPPQPHSPAYIPVPIPTISPYHELQGAVEATNNIAGMWESDLFSAQLSRKHPLAEGERLSPQERAQRKEADEQTYRELVTRADERGIDRWHSVADAVKKAHSDAVARMSQWTPNQISKDRTEFEGLLASMEWRTEDPSNPDRQKFDPLLSYLRGLQNKLGDYPESVTPSQ